MSIIGEMYEEDIEKMEKAHKAELAGKEELLNAYREKVEILEKLLLAKDEKLKLYEKYFEDVKRILDKTGQNILP
jgi:hypothetical protein